jgi:hypothetical protein
LLVVVVGLAQGAGAASLNWWPLSDTNWLSVNGCGPLAFTNLVLSTNADGYAMGNGRALEVDHSGPAFLNYRSCELDGSTNLLLYNGAVMVWVRPRWSSADQGGGGPGEAVRIIEVGNFTVDASFGWWSVWLDSFGTNLFFSSQAGGLGTNYLTAPVSWASNCWHLIAINYTCSNSSAYIDGVSAATGPGVCYVPGGDALAGGFFVGSDSNGLCQAKADFSSLSTYDAPLYGGEILENYQLLGTMWYGVTLSTVGQGQFGPDVFGSGATFDVVSGPGNLTTAGASASCVTGGRFYLTNASCSLQTNLTSTLQFSVAGGQAGAPYDLFGIANLPSPGLPGGVWSWLGTVYACTNYVLTNQPTVSGFYLLANKQDTDGDGLTDAYEVLVSKTSPTNAYSVSATVPDGWWVGNGMPPVQGADGSDPDLDGLSNKQEYLYGTRPLVSEGFSIWLSEPLGNGGLP